MRKPEVKILEAGATQGAGEETDEADRETEGGVVSTVETTDRSTQGESDPAARVSGSLPGLVSFRSCLVFDAESAMRQRFEKRCVFRAELAEHATQT